MKNWVALRFVYDFNPSPYNYLKFKWYHFHFLLKENTSFTASLYFDNLKTEVSNDIVREKSISKKSLTLALIKQILESEPSKQELVVLFEQKLAAPDEEIKLFLQRVNSLLQTVPDEKKGIVKKEEPLPVADFPVRTYVIATHMYLELHNNESHYDMLIRDTTALKEFITEKFKANRLAGRIADMKSFSYKRILSGKNNGSAIGQLKPQIEQVALNPVTFGEDVAAFANTVLRNIPG